MIAKFIGHQHFVDDTERSVFENENGQFVWDDDGEQLYGVWLRDEEDEQKRRARQNRLPQKKWVNGQLRR